MWERAGAASGIAFVAFLLASFVVIPEAPPALNDPIADIRSYFVDHSSAFQASAYLTGLAGFFFLWFLGSLGAALDRTASGRSARGVVAPAGAIVLALAFVNVALLDTLATRVAAESDQAVIRALYDVQAFVITMAAFAIAAFVAAVSVASTRAQLLPRLVDRLGLVVALAWFISGFGVFAESGAFSPTGAVGFVVLLLWLAWIVVVSGSLLRRSGATPAADAT